MDSLPSSLFTATGRKARDYLMALMGCLGASAQWADIVDNAVVAADRITVYGVIYRAIAYAMIVHSANYRLKSF